MNKKKLIIIIVILVILSIIVLLLITNKEEKKTPYLIEYITNKNFISESSNIYENKNNDKVTCNEESEHDCEGTKEYFNVDKLDYYKIQIVKKDGVSFRFIPLYNYKTDKISYHYRATYNNGNLMYFGDYDLNTKEFTCNIEYNYGINANKDTMCNYIKQEILIFSKEVKLFITDPKLLEVIKK